ncbi:thymidine phosphorylase, partial [Streptosporangium sandarakinum]
VLAPASGVLATLDAYGVGLAAWRLGAGRERKEDPVSFGAGITLHAKPGDEVREGQPLMTLHADDASRFERALAALEGAYTVGETADPGLLPLVIDRVTA